MNTMMRILTRNTERERKIMATPITYESIVEAKMRQVFPNAKIVKLTGGKYELALEGETILTKFIIYPERESMTNVNVYAWRLTARRSGCAFDHAREESFNAKTLESAWEQLFAMVIKKARDWHSAATNMSLMCSELEAFAFA